MQAIRGGQAGSALLVGFGGGIFAGIPARTMVYARHQGSALAFPDEGFRRDLPLAFGAFGQVQRLELGLQAFVPLAGGGQFRQRGPQVRLGGRDGQPSRAGSA